MRASERRQHLLEWFYADEERSGWTARQIAEAAYYWKQERVPHLTADLYKDNGYADYADICASDLKKLAAEGHVVRGEGVPARWWHAS